jgi:hypothetical protein
MVPQCTIKLIGAGRVKNADVDSVMDPSQITMGINITDLQKYWNKVV